MFDEKVIAKNNGNGTFLVDVNGGIKIFHNELKKWGTMCNSFLSEYNNKKAIEKYASTWLVGLDNCEVWDDYYYNTSRNYPVLFDPVPNTFDFIESCNITDGRCVVNEIWWARNDT